MFPRQGREMLGSRGSPGHSPDLSGGTRQPGSRAPPCLFVIVPPERRALKPPLPLAGSPSPASPRGLPGGTEAAFAGGSQGEPRQVPISAGKCAEEGGCEVRASVGVPARSRAPRHGPGRPPPPRRCCGSPSGSTPRGAANASMFKPKQPRQSCFSFFIYSFN